MKILKKILSFVVSRWKIVVLLLVAAIVIYWMVRPDVSKEQYKAYKESIGDWKKGQTGIFPKPEERKKEVQKDLINKEILYNAPFVGGLFRLFSK